MNHLQETRLNVCDLNPDVLEGANIYGRDDEKIGWVQRVYGTGRSMTVVIDIGPYLGVDRKEIALSVQDLSFTSDATDSLHIASEWSKTELKDIPVLQPL